MKFLSSDEISVQYTFLFEALFSRKTEFENLSSILKLG